MNADRSKYWTSAPVPAPSSAFMLLAMLCGRSATGAPASGSQIHRRRWATGASGTDLPMSEHSTIDAFSTPGVSRERNCFPCGKSTPTSTGATSHVPSSHAGAA